MTSCSSIKGYSGVKIEKQDSEYPGSAERDSDNDVNNHDNKHNQREGQVCYVPVTEKLLHSLKPADSVLKT
jgi:hypothetical protein